MENLKNIFVTYNIANQLKEIGFNEPCMGHSDNDNNFRFFANLTHCNTNSEFGFYPTVPTYEQVKHWLMENHLIFITVNCEKWLSQFKGEVETSDALIETEMFYNYNEALRTAIEIAIQTVKEQVKQFTEIQNSK